MQTHREKTLCSEPARRLGQRVFSGLPRAVLRKGRDSPAPPGFMGALSSPHSFTTRKGQKFCGNPKLPWVQKYVKNLDAKQKKASARARAMSTTAPFWRHLANSTFI